MRVVLDTNVLVSALLYGKQLAFIAAALHRRTITPCFTVATFEELTRVFSYPHITRSATLLGIAPADITTRLKEDGFFVVEPPSIFSFAPLADPGDRAILACAVVARAEALVSGDQHLLALRKSFGVLILTPAQFRTYLASRR